MSAGGGVTWPVWADWYYPGVYDRDFVDSDVNSNGDDNIAFDPPGGAIAMYSGHGVCNDYPVDANGSPIDQHCTTSSDCTHPGTGSDGSIQTAPGSCTRGPTSYVNHGTCIYSAPRYIVSCSPGNDAFNEFVDYSDGLVAFGESAYSGSWGGAGTNGGINFAILDISCAVRPGHESQGLRNAFAGVHDIGTLMPTTYLADATDTSLRGAKFSARWRSNNNSSISWSWAYMINDMPITDGSGCGGLGWRAQGGGRGFSGCGANWTGTVAQDNTTAWFLNQNETWIQVQNDAHDATGAGWITWTYFCNYDCNRYPITL